MAVKNRKFATKEAQISTQIDVRYAKLPPQELELEKAVLGILMLEPTKVPEIMDKIQSEEVFYDAKYRMVFQAIKSLYVGGSQVDLLTVSSEMRKLGTLEDVGGAFFLTEITMSVVSSGHISTWIEILIELYRRRRLIEVAGYILSEAYEMELSSQELITNVYIKIGEFSQDTGQREVKTIEQLQMEKIRQLEEAMTSGKDMFGGSTGIRPLDNMLKGLQKKRLGIIAARPAVGKTAFMLQLARGLANDPINDNRVAIFSLEMDGTELSERNLASTSKVSMNAMSKASTLSTEDIKRMLSATHSIPQNKIYIDDSVVSDWRSMVGRIGKMKEKYGITHVFLDYLQLMSNSEKGGNREREVADITRQLKLAAKSLDIHITSLCQLNRESERRADLKPKLSDLRESGSIEQDADWVIALYKATEEMVANDGADPNGRAAAVLKNRSGDIGEQMFVFQGATQTFILPDEVIEEPRQIPYDNPYAGINPSARPTADFWNEP